jgi:hypothetical protein
MLREMYVASDSEAAADCLFVSSSTRTPLPIPRKLLLRRSPLRYSVDQVFLVLSTAMVSGGGLHPHASPGSQGVHGPLSPAGLRAMRSLSDVIDCG